MTLAITVTLVSLYVMCFGICIATVEDNYTLPDFMKNSPRLKGLYVLLAPLSCCILVLCVIGIIIADVLKVLWSVLKAVLFGTKIKRF